MITYNRLAAFVMFSFIISAFLSCDSSEVKPNLNDTTPPVINWTVDNATTFQKSTFTGSANMTLPKGNEIVVTACVVDEESGVKELTSYTNSPFGCRMGDVVQQPSGGLIVPETSPLGLDVNGLAYKRYCRISRTKLDFACAPGFTLASGTVVFHLEGKNFVGLSGSADLVISVTP